jgi:beta-glucanase (GH16 family)
MMQIEAAVRFGWNPKSNKRGIWPAFWTMGDSIRHGTPWPQCGELDIMEQLNGEPVAHGTAHCGVVPGGPCNEQTGITATTPIVDDAFHVWAVRIDRRNADWTQQVITWFRDGQQFHSITGARIGDQAVWSTLAHSPLYIIFNVAVGGTLPGDTDDSTMGGYGSMMEFGQVAVYST